MIADYHTHTPLCRHASGEPEEYVRAAHQKGLCEYGISDHAPQEPEPFDDWRMELKELPSYFQWVERARNAAPEGLAIRLGLECDWLPGNESFIEQLSQKADWDYLIGSLHYLSGVQLPGKTPWNFDHPQWLGKWQEIDVDSVWEHYWKEYLQMVKSGLFDILGHADLIKKFGRTPSGDLDRFYEPVIEVLAEKGLTLELNTAGWNKPCQEQYPADRFLELAAQAGVSLVISSDAHAPEEVAQHFDRAFSLAQNIGFQETVLFEKRQKKSVPFDLVS